MEHARVYYDKKKNTWTIYTVANLIFSGGLKNNILLSSLIILFIDAIHGQTGWRWSHGQFRNRCTTVVRLWTTDDIRHQNSYIRPRKQHNPDTAESNTFGGQRERKGIKVITQNWSDIHGQTGWRSHTSDLGNGWRTSPFTGSRQTTSGSIYEHIRRAMCDVEWKGTKVKKSNRINYKFIAIVT